jgi:circadian clock protein KaiB
MRSDGSPTVDAITLRLYVAGNAPNSVRARANLSALCEVLAQPYTLEVVDVLVAPLRAFTDGILLTPTLVKLAPPPSSRMVGDLSDTARVRAALGMNDQHDAS